MSSFFANAARFGIALANGVERKRRDSILCGLALTDNVVRCEDKCVNNVLYADLDVMAAVDTLPRKTVREAFSISEDCPATDSCCGGGEAASATSSSKSSDSSTSICVVSSWL